MRRLTTWGWGGVVVALALVYLLPPLLKEKPEWQILADDPCAEWMNRNWQKFDSKEAMTAEYVECVNWHVRRTTGE